MVHYHCLLLSSPKSLILKELNFWLGSLGEKEIRGKKFQSNTLPSVSVTFAGSSVGQSTALAALVHTAVPGSWGCDVPREEPQHTQQPVEQCLLQRAVLGCVLSSPKNLEPFSLELLTLLTPHNLQRWHSPKISQMLNV